MDSRSLSPKGSYDFSKSPYYQSLASFKKQPLPNILKSQTVKKSPLLQTTISERKKTEDQLANMEHRVMKMRRKEEQAAHKLQTTKQRAEMFSATRLQFEEVTARQLETAKQQKREETLKALMQKRREIIDTRLAVTQKMTTSRSEILEVKRVFPTQKRALQLKENRIAAISDMQERQLQLRLEKLRVKESQNVSKAGQLAHGRSQSQNQDMQLQEEVHKLRLAREKVGARQIKELEESEKAMQENVVKMQAEEGQAEIRMAMKQKSDGKVSKRSPRTSPPIES